MVAIVSAKGNRTGITKTKQVLRRRCGGSKGRQPIDYKGSFGCREVWRVKQAVILQLCNCKSFLSGMREDELEYLRLFSCLTSFLTLATENSRRLFVEILLRVILTFILQNKLVCKKVTEINMPLRSMNEDAS